MPSQLVKNNGGVVNPYDAGSARVRHRKKSAKVLALWGYSETPQRENKPDYAPELDKLPPGAIHAGTEPTQYLTEADRLAIERVAWKLVRVARSEAGLEQEFHELAAKWYRDTRTTSSLRKMVAHPAYLRIIGMGREAVPLLLHELERTRDHWLVALNATTGKDPAPLEANYDEAVDAWLAWGRREGHI